MAVLGSPSVSSDSRDISRSVLSGLLDDKIECLFHGRVWGGRGLLDAGASHGIATMAPLGRACARQVGRKLQRGAKLLRVERTGMGE